MFAAGLALSHKTQDTSETGSRVELPLKHETLVLLAAALKG